MLAPPPLPRAALALALAFALLLACRPPRAAAEQRLHVCGRELAETLSLLCRDRGGFNDPPAARPGGAGAVAGGATRRGGVADDCCRLGCTLSTLLRYCKFDDVVQPRPQPAGTAGRGEDSRDGDACVEDDDELFSLQLLHRPEGWCGTWQPAGPASPSGEVECTCSRGGGEGDQLENVVRKGPRKAHRQSQPSRQRHRQQPRRQLSRQPPTTPATRRPVVRGTATPYFAGRPIAVVLSPPQTPQHPATL